MQTVLLSHQNQGYGQVWLLKTITDSGFPTTALLHNQGCARIWKEAQELSSVGSAAQPAYSQLRPNMITDT